MFHLSARLDHAMMSSAVNRQRGLRSQRLDTRWIDSSVGCIRVFDSGGDKPCIVMSPDGPNVIEHYDAVITLLSEHFRVICFDMPGFGFSSPSKNYAHTLGHGARAIEAVMNQRAVKSATLAFSCANGFYAIRFAQLNPSRVDRLVLSQTPSLAAMHRWTERIVPSILKVPLMGQILSRVFRKKMAHGWYRVALPKKTPTEPYQRISAHSLRCGGCFSLAGVVQGLLRESSDTNRLKDVPCTVIWGGNDRSHSRTLPASLLDDVPHAQFILMDECGHFPDLENSQMFVQIVLQVAGLSHISPQTVGLDGLGVEG